MGRRRIPRLRLRRLQSNKLKGVRRRRLPRIPFRESLTRLPNVLTYLRILAIPGVIWLLWRSGRGAAVAAPWWAFAAALGFTLAAITDALDGWLARRRDQQTVLGRFLDPVADKLLVMAVLVELVALERIAPWIAMVLIAREMAVNALRTIAVTEGFEVRVARLGKWKTAAQFVAIIALMLHYPFTVPLVDVVVDPSFVGGVAIAVAVALSLASAGLYFRRFVRAILARESG